MSHLETNVHARQRRECQVTEVINFLEGYWHPRLAKLFPASWFIKLRGCTETVGLNTAVLCAKRAELYSQRPCFQEVLKFMTTPQRAGSLPAYTAGKQEADNNWREVQTFWTSLNSVKETVISRLTGRNKVICWSLRKCHFKIHRQLLIPKLKNTKPVYAPPPSFPSNKSSVSTIFFCV